MDSRSLQPPRLLLLVFCLQVACACHQDTHNPDCWYQLWYFWLILIGLLLSIIVLVVFYCKYQAKNRSRVGFLGRRPRMSMSIAVGPPPYDAPSNNPPPYHIAMQNSQAVSAYRASCSPPGFIEEYPDFFYPGSAYPCEPPPYSPPPSHPPTRLQVHRPPTLPHSRDSSARRALRHHQARPEVIRDQPDPPEDSS